ncbi:hypothetical protein B0H63DRAFT_430452 [Podospora didyma]|uniref:Prolyl 4-hydroxylase alpha subunit domain-containing protein n=1 Tax=Podospora didyma TaxID=330526 RepID=A0AAE0NS15_9PEZI|nr:hypothetical protein B0H63DRAFT_430452 [Podospora didyma]
MAGPLHVLIISLTVAVSAYLGPMVLDYLLITSQLSSQLASFNFPFLSSKSSSEASTGGCLPHSYTTQLVSLDPLLIYIHNFVSAAESASIIAAGVPLLAASPITGAGSDTVAPQTRTSLSAPLPSNHATVSCILARAESFMGTLFLPGRDDMGVAQLVQYTDTQKFDLHRDWFARPRLLDTDAAAGRKRLYNRLATLFVVLRAEGIEEGSGETWFPLVKGIHDPPSPTQKVEGEDGENKEGLPLWREHEDGGLAFKPVAGNALFWVNLFPGKNGSGDARTLHAGLPVQGPAGLKTGMNIWPRTFFGPDA